MTDYASSLSWYQRALKVTPGGSQTGSKAPGKVGPLGAYPLYVDRADSARIWGVDLSRPPYLDWYNGNCAVTLGHGHQEVTAAVTHAVKTGALLSLASTLEVEVAECLVQLIPCAEQIRFVVTGSEACAAAARIARMATGRNVIVVAEGQYHGWHDWHCVTKPYHPGVPEGLGSLVRTFRFNDFDGLEQALRAQDVAAVMVEPDLTERPAPRFLSDIVRLAHRHGALAIFDEMICAGRLALGGAQEFHGVTPDLACFGKAFGNGVPIAFVAGPADLMQHAWPISGTYGASQLGLAACRAVLHVYQRDDVIGHIRRVGQRLMDGVNGMVRRYGLNAEMVGHPSRPKLVWNVARPLELVTVSLFQQELAERGVIAHSGGWNPSLAHTPDVLDATLHAIDGALAQMAVYLTDGDPQQFLRGELIQPAFTRPA